MEASCKLTFCILLFCVVFRINSEHNQDVAAHLQKELKAEFKDEYPDNIIQSITI